MSEYSDETVVISGASSGIGRDAARRLGEKGYRVLAGVRRMSDAETLRGFKGVTPILLDVTDPTSISALAENPALQAGRVHLVNNAGIATGGPVETTPLVRWRELYEVNMFGLIALTQALLPHVRRERGRVVNISSVSGRAAMPYLAPYASSKFALEAVSDSLRRELKQFGVEVVVIQPGPVRTPIWEKGLAGAATGENSPYYAELAAFQRLVNKSAEVAVDVGHVSAAIRHALQSKRPRSRYLVGSKSARLEAILAAWLPDRWLDKLISAELGKTPKKP